MATCASAFLGMICRACRTTCWEMLLSWLVLWHPKSDRDMWIFTAYSWRYIISHRLSPVISWMICKWRHLCYTKMIWLLHHLAKVLDLIQRNNRDSPPAHLWMSCTRPCRSSNQSQRRKAEKQTILVGDVNLWPEYELSQPIIPSMVEKHRFEATNQNMTRICSKWSKTWSLHLNWPLSSRAFPVSSLSAITK